ncbi:MAG: dienelactone hydrolase family protein, partial [Gammaproteobacteria bacterium]
GYLARADGDAPNVVVIQEWWGLNEQIKGVAERFAAAGFNAMAPDLYAGRVAEDADEANHMMTGLDWVGATEQEVRGAVQHLNAMGGKTAVMGFCMGGALTVIAGVKIPEASAAVCFYGIPPAEQADPRLIRAPFQGHFASNDDWCTPQAVDDLSSKLVAGGVDHELHRYEGEHAFFNEQVPAYNKEAAELAWRRTVDFLNTRLR